MTLIRYLEICWNFPVKQAVLENVWEKFGDIVWIHLFQLEFGGQMEVPVHLWS